MKAFPIQGRENYSGEPVKIPWDYAEEAYKEYSARYGTQQSLERMAERMGFGVYEIIDLLVKRIRRIESTLPRDCGEDTKRLDWLSNQFTRVDEDNCRQSVHVGLLGLTFETGTTLREAIDAAMKSQP